MSVEATADRTAASGATVDSSDPSAMGPLRARPRATPVPAADGTWRGIDGSDGRYAAIDDAANDPSSPVEADAAYPRTWHTLSEPRVSLDSARHAQASLVLTLERQPAPDERTLAPLVVGASFAMTLTILPSPEQLAALAADSTDSYIALYPTGVRFELIDGAGARLAETEAHGAIGSAAISGWLGRAAALSALGAIDGTDHSIRVRATVGYRASGAANRGFGARLDLGSLYTTLSRVHGSGAVISLHQLADDISTLATAGALVFTSQPEPATADPEVALAIASDVARAGMAVLVPTTATAHAADPGPWFRLRQPPAAQMTMTIRHAAGPGFVDREYAVEAALSDALRAARSSPGGASAIVRAVVTGPDGATEPVARRVPTARAGPPGESTPFARTADGAAALSAVLRTGARKPALANSLAVSGLARTGTALNWSVNDLVIAVFDPNRLESLPVIDAGHANDGLWPDRLDGTRWWYAPELAPVPPTAASTPADAPFLYRFTATGHDSQGHTGIEASVRVVLKRSMSPDVEAAWHAHGDPAVQPVPLGGLGVALEIPFRDERGATTSYAIAASELSDDGSDTVTATFSLTDTWARLAYGALAFPGYQSQPPRLRCNYTYAAYVEVVKEDLRIDWGGKLAITPLRIAGGLRANTEPMRQPDPLLDPDPAVVERSIARPVAAFAVAANRPVNTAVFAASELSNAVFVSPVLATTVIMLPPKTYGVQTLGRSPVSDLVVPCADAGALYVQGMDDGTQHAVGCQDAFAIGQTQLRLYERVDVSVDGHRPNATVYRSLAVPGRFLVVPDEYAVGRYEPSDARAYRPAIVMFSAVDAVHPEQTQIVVMAAFEPRLAPFERRALVGALASLHPDPTLVWPTELPGQPQVTWALAGTGAAAVSTASVKTPDGFQVSLSTGLGGALQLQQMLTHGAVHGAATFDLGDGTTATTSLGFDLTQIGGPFDAGPLEVAVHGTEASLQNRIERAIDVDSLRLYDGIHDVGSVAVNQRLPPNGQAVVGGVSAAGQVVPVYSIVPGDATLDEIRTFVEDVTTNVVFLTPLDLSTVTGGLVHVQARLADGGAEAPHEVTLSVAAPTAEQTFVLPLTRYLDAPTLEFRAHLDGVDPPATWQSWRLDTQGNVISLSAQLIGAN